MCSDLHRKYRNDAVRISPDELHYITASAFENICSHRQINSKCVKFYGLIEGILTGIEIGHSRVRRWLAHAFSDWALREQESILEYHMKLLLEKIRTRMYTKSGKGKIQKNIQFLALKIISNLAIRKSFDCLEYHKFHPYIHLAAQAFQFEGLPGIANRFSLGSFLCLSESRSGKIANNSIPATAKECFDKCLARETDRPGLMVYTQRQRRPN